MSQAPAAFGLVSFLMHSGLEKKHIQGHLLAFSAASPVVAIAAYFILHAVKKQPVSEMTPRWFDSFGFTWLWAGFCPQSGSSAPNQLSATGVGMLFSAGTFLYVATAHVLPEISSSSSKGGPLSSDLQEHTEVHQHRYLGLLKSLTLVLGVGLPMLLALGLRDD